MFRTQVVLKTNRAVDELQVTSIQTWTGPYGSGKLRLPACLETVHIKVVRQSALRACRCYHPEDVLGTHYC